MKILKEGLIIFITAVGTTICLIGGYILGIVVIIGITALIHKILVKLFPNKFKKPEDDFEEIEDTIAEMLIENGQMQDLIDKGDVIVEHVMYDDDNEIDTVYYYNKNKYRYGRHKEDN